MKTRGGLVVVIMVLMFGALATMLVELYENRPECTCEMVKNRECVR